jgi:hypothetical protein
LFTVVNISSWARWIMPTIKFPEGARNDPGSHAHHVAKRQLYHAPSRWQWPLAHGPMGQDVVAAGMSFIKARPAA